MSDLKELVEFCEKLTKEPLIKSSRNSTGRVVHERPCFLCRHSELDCDACTCKNKTGIFAQWFFFKEPLIDFFLQIKFPS